MCVNLNLREVHVVQIDRLNSIRASSVENQFQFTVYDRVSIQANLLKVGPLESVRINEFNSIVRQIQAFSRKLMEVAAVKGLDVVVLDAEDRRFVDAMEKKIIHGFLGEILVPFDFQAVYEQINLSRSQIAGAAKQPQLL